MDEKKFFELSGELSKIYLEIKSIILLAEDEDPEQNVVLTCINELRNAFDHVMKTFSEGESLEHNFEKAKGHLYRAGFDAYEVISIFLLKDIQNIRKNYTYEAITSAFPDYFSKVIPTIERIKLAKVDARGNKTVNKTLTPEDHFKEYEEVVKDLMLLKEDLDLHITGIKDAQKSIRKTNFRNRVITLVLSIIAGAVVAFIVFLLS